ncbi:MAG: V-type ATP synthase subunit I [Clostridia bacterium]|nr:V-type ATP synthase subunit I [Clostridia bacterium]
MAKLKVMSVELIAPISEKEKILEYLQKKGTVEITDVSDSGENGASDPEKRAEIAGSVSLIEHALDILNARAPEKKPLTAMLDPRKELDDGEYRKSAGELSQTLEAAKRMVDLENEAADIDADTIRLRTYADTLSPWENVSPPEVTLKYVSVLCGSFRKELSRSDLLIYLAEALPERDCVEVETLSQSEEHSAFAVYCFEEDEAEFEQALREFGFVPAPELENVSFADKIKEIRGSIAAGEQRKAQIDAELVSMRDMHEKFRFALDELSIRADRLTANERLYGTGRVFALRGYCAEKHSAKLKKRIEGDFNAVFEVTEPSEDEDVPVILSNNAFASPLENITGMYSMPGKEDIDPTGFMAFFYYFFFGMMLSDAGYGLLISLATGGALLFKKDMEPKMKNNVKMYLFCGLSTVFWGAMYGSWFGDVGHVIMREFFGRDINPLPPLWTDAVSDTMNVLIMCFILGLAHLFWGVLMKGYNDLKHGQKLDALCDTVPTFLTVIGIAPIFFGLFAQSSVPDNYTPLGTFFFNVFTAVHTNLKSVSTYILIAGVVLVIATAGRHSASIGGKIGGGLYAVYNLFSGYLGDVLSYARLLALGMATGVIAQVMNMLGTLPSNPVVKVIMFIPVFLAGHAANLAINLIGAYVHTNRLQYVEFFSKFYEGGGRAFEPFEAKTKFYRFKEEL